MSLPDIPAHLQADGLLHISNAVHLGDVVRLSYAVAQRAIAEELEDLPGEADPVFAAFGTDTTAKPWRDTRPLLDDREHAPQVIDMWAQNLALAELTGLIVRHPLRHYLVRLTRKPA